ncbi:MAG: hypothetical protein H5U07_08935 [Candidatus Aminicenantes bacterium]|nr:hypothetical protein [Candidatus Aminicenantes bacterium]
MEKENLKITAITAEDLAVIKEELSRTNHPLPLSELAERLAFAKTSSQRTKPVKIYDPYAKYEIGDYIYREYDENLQVGSKVTEHFQGGVVLKVVNKINYPDFNCEMLEVDYDGGGPFRKYIDYMKKTRTQVLLPSNLEGKGLEPQFLPGEADPRQTELPMTEKDLKTLARNLRKALAALPEFFSWNDYWQLTSKRVEIDEDKIKAISEELANSRQSESTQNLIRKHFNLEPAHDQFELYCLSLNYLLEKKYRKEFICLSTRDWGRWHLKSVLNRMPEGLPISRPPVPVPDLGEVEGLQFTRVDNFPVKVYLTWREILSGAVRLPKSLSREFNSREYQLVDDEDGKAYTVYYFPEGNYLLGLAEYFKAHNIPQGSSLTLDRKGPEQFTFWIKKSKKKMPVLKLEYDPQTDRFKLGAEEGYTLALTNKSVQLEKEIVEKLLTMYEECVGLDLRQLLGKLFKTPELTGNSRSLHFMRAYHMVDLLRPTTAEDVEYVLNAAPEFIVSEKKEGVFIYQESLLPKEETVEEERIDQALIETLAEQLATGVEEKEEEKAEPVVQPEAEAKEAVPPEAKTAVEEEAEPEVEVIELEPEQVQIKLEPLKKEKEKEKLAEKEREEREAKKKKTKTGEKGPKSRKSERRVIEEKILEEESEIEALEAIKSQEEEELEVEIGEEETIEVELEAEKEEPKFGFFAEMLKTALSKKQPENKEEEEKPQIQILRE